MLYDEVDVWDAGVFVHRLLFWPHYRETDIVFEGLSITRTSRLDRPVEASEVGSLCRDLVWLGVWCGTVQRWPNMNTAHGFAHSARRAGEESRSRSLRKSKQISTLHSPSAR